MNLDRLQRIMFLASAFFFALLALGVVGEHLGWWNAVGELLVALGSIGGILTAVLGSIMAATKSQVRRVGNAVLAGNTMLGAANSRLGSMDDRLGSMDGKLDRIDVKLDKLDRIDVKLDKLDGLDVIQLQLDRQTGVLDRQVALLVQIRDRLPG